MRLRVVALPFVLAGALAHAQTPVRAPENNYTPAQDVELGRKAAADAERQLPILHDDEVEGYVQRIGGRLVDGIPREFQHPEFRYTFQVVNVKEINAFALPGGPMFVNRGMLEAAHSEGEVAGVMAHELSHVVLRHGTAQAGKATKFEIGQLAGAVLGAIVGGRTGSLISEGTRFGLGTAFLRFGREYERDADIEGTHIMARAGYDPRDMANVFRTIERESGPGGPEWLSDHPNPGNRYEYITAEAQALRVENPVRDARAFESVQARLHAMPPAPTTEQATRNAKAGTPAGTTGARPTGRVAPPAQRFTSYEEGNTFRVSVPSNWRELSGTNAVTFAPDGAYGQANGRGVFTHGIEIGVARNESHDLQTATQELADSLSQSNPQLSRPGTFRNVSIDGQRSLRTILSNVSDATGRPETIVLATTLLRGGNLFYAIGVAPRDEFDDYAPVFDRVIGSIDLIDR